MVVIHYVLPFLLYIFFHLLYIFQFPLYLQVGEFFRASIKNREGIAALRPNVFNQKLEAIGVTPIKNLNKSVEMYKLGMHCKPLCFNIFLFLYDKEASLMKLRSYWKAF